MLRPRVIPILLLRGKGLVKTVKFGSPKYIGDPINAIKIFNDKETDELVFLDIEASKNGRKPDFELIKSIATECFMPLAYGGGVTTMDDIARLFALGVEKVIINSASLQDCSLISEAAATFGSQSIVLSVDVKKNVLGAYQVYSHSGVKHPRTDLLSYVRDAETAGAGEIILNAVDRDGTMQGYDLKLVRMVADSTQVPLVACGGAGTLSDIGKAIEAGASGVGAGSLFVFHGPHKAVLINYPTQEELCLSLSQ
jgi:cyclase